MLTILRRLVLLLVFALALPAAAGAETPADCPTWFPDFRCDRSGRFEGFENTIVQPFLFEDPFITTNVSAYYIWHDFPRKSVFQGGDLSTVAVQARVALTDRLALIATKDGFAWNYPDTELSGLTVLPNTQGWFNIAGGFKYALLKHGFRDSDEAYRQLDSLKPVWWATQVLVFLVVLFGSRRLEDHHTMALSFLFVIFLTAPTFYYYQMLVIPFMLFLPDRERPGLSVGMSAFFAWCVLCYTWGRMWPLGLTLSRLLSWSLIALGAVVEAVARQPLDVFCAERIFGPLGMEGTSFALLGDGEPELPAAVRRRVAATENCPWRGRIVWGEVHDPNASVMGGVAGHAGLFSTVDDVMIFAQTLLDVWHGRSDVWPRELLRQFTSRQRLPETSDWALGWDTPTEGASSSGSYFSRNSVGHLGFTGTSLWIDLEQEVVIVLLTNRVHLIARRSRFELRPKVHDLIIEAFREG